MAICNDCLEANEHHTDVARNVLLFFTAASESPNGDLKQSTTQLIKALGYLAEKENFELGDCIHGAWSETVAADGNPRQFTRAAATLGIELLNLQKVLDY
jgi:hypothetical protein